MTSRTITPGITVTNPPVPDEHGWLPIEAAPKDGTTILGIDKYSGKYSDPCIARWDDEGREWWSDDLYQYVFPTHFLPGAVPPRNQDKG